MNNYPEWWNQTVTVYNKFEDAQTKVVTWYRTVLSDCFWKYIHEKVKVGEVVLDSNTTICRIPKNSKFLEKYQWINIPNDKKSDYFTLGIGDIVVRGEIFDNIDEYKSGSRSTDTIAKYKKLQGCLVVEEVGINVDGGRGDEHYVVRGI